MTTRILVVEDEKPIADIIQFNLQKEGFSVECIDNGEEAIQKVHASPPDLILLDLMLPGADGFEVCKQIRKQFQMPIIMLTAKDSEFDKVLGLELGADDYMTKPFSNRELLARIKANLRRIRPAIHTEIIHEQDVLHIGELTICPTSYTVKKQATTIDLTHREFDLILHLAKHLNQVVTREDLLQSVWGNEYDGDVRTVDVTIRRLREKIEDDPGAPRFIITRRGIGYTMRPPV